MENTILTKYIDKIYKYALSSTFSEGEAEELSQEILLTVLVALPKLREERKFEPWLWAVAENTSRSFRQGDFREAGDSYRNGNLAAFRSSKQAAKGV